MSGTAVQSRTFLRPPAPVPRAEPLGPLALLSALWKNPLEAWVRAHFERPVAAVNLIFGRIILLNDPAAIRRVLLENMANYRKDRLQGRIISSAFKNGLLMAESERACSVARWPRCSRADP